MGLKLPDGNKIIEVLMWTIGIYAIVSYLINISAVTSGDWKNWLVVHTASDTPFLQYAISVIVIVVIAYFAYKIVFGFTGEAFNRRSLLTTGIVAGLFIAIYYFVLGPYISTGHLPTFSLELTTANIKSGVQSLISLK